MNPVYRHLLTMDVVKAEWNVIGNSIVHEWIFGHNEGGPVNNGPVTRKPRWGPWVVLKDQDDWSDGR